MDKIKEELEITFKNNPNRLKHIYGVRDLAVYLGEKYGCDPYKCEVAALLHDIHKNLSYEKQLEFLSQEEIDSMQTKVLAHAYSASNYIKNKYDFLEEDVIIAVRSHVYGNMNMSLLDKIILLSDFCEENRTYDYCLKTRKVLLDGDFDKALKMTLSLTIKSLLERGQTPTDEQININRKYGE
ncbi:MAG: bis(5'-nucleosyl)-tetraphosphatase (symmetrical) YqeK [bacterium]